MSDHNETRARTKPTLGDYGFTLSAGVIIALFTAYDLAGNWFDAIRYVVFGMCLLAANDARSHLIKSWHTIKETR